MPDYEHNLYYYPEKSGLKIVAQIDYSDQCYQYDTRVVWKDKRGQFFTARDSGCSCPTPFETFDLTNIDILSIRELRREVREEVNNKSQWSSPNISAEQGQEFVRKVELALLAEHDKRTDKAKKNKK